MSNLWYSVYTNKGKVRSDNEDSYLVMMEPYPLIAVADGMGGHQAGEVASKLAVKFLEKYKFNYNDQLTNKVKLAITEANKLIYIKGENNVDYQGMGTTLSMGIIYNMTLYYGHVGDSRIYLYRNNNFQQLSKDHSLVNELLEKNKISSSEVFDHPQKNVITQALGTSLDLNIETGKINLKKDDRLLFCTDGLHDMLRFNEIKEMFNTFSDIDKLSDELGQQAMNKGGNDNITLIILQV